MNRSKLPAIEVLGEFDHGMSNPILMEGRDSQGTTKDELSSPQQLKEAFWNAERAVDKTTKKICDGVGHWVEGILMRSSSTRTTLCGSKKNDPKQKCDHEEDCTDSSTDPEWILFHDPDRS